MPRPGGRLLTAGEERVAGMAAGGSTNEEIAAHLYLARRTVEAHLTSVYRKLGIRGRSQLPAALERLDPDGLPGLPLSAAEAGLPLSAAAAGLAVVPADSAAVRPR